MFLAFSNPPTCCTSPLDVHDRDAQVAGDDVRQIGREAIGREREARPSGEKAGSSSANGVGGEATQLVSLQIVDEEIVEAADQRRERHELAVRRPGGIDHFVEPFERNLALLSDPGPRPLL